MPCERIYGVGCGGRLFLCFYSSAARMMWERTKMEFVAKFFISLFSGLEGAIDEFGLSGAELDDRAREFSD